MNGNIICGDCLRKKTGNLALPEVDAYSARNILMPLDSTSLAALRYISGAPLSRSFAFSVSNGDSLALLGKATETFLLNHLERSFDTLEFYRAVQ